MAWNKGLRNAIKENLGFRGSQVRSHFTSQNSTKLSPSQQRHIAYLLCCLQNIAAWAFAGVLAYYLWVRPEQEAEKERRVRGPF